MKNIKIRKIRKSDAEQWVKLKNEVWRSAYAHVFPQEVFDKQDAEADSRIEKFKQRELNKNGDVSFVAEDCGRLVALVGGQALSFIDYYKEKGFAELGAIYIHKDYQNFGLGRKLFDLIVKEFLKQGCTKMVIGVLKDNPQAHKAYEKWGCKLDTDFEDMFERLGRGYPRIFYLFDIE